MLTTLVVPFVWPRCWRRCSYCRRSKTSPACTPAILARAAAMIVLMNMLPFVCRSTGAQGVERLVHIRIKVEYKSAPTQFARSETVKEWTGHNDHKVPRNDCTVEAGTSPTAVASEVQRSYLYSHEPVRPIPGRYANDLPPVSKTSGMSCLTPGMHHADPQRPAFHMHGMKTTASPPLPAPKLWTKAFWHLDPVDTSQECSAAGSCHTPLSSLAWPATCLTLA